MLEVKKLLFLIENNIESVISEDSPLGIDLWHIFLEQHPADIAMLIGKLDESEQTALFQKLPRELSIHVFQKLVQNIQAILLIKLDIDHAMTILHQMPSDELTDLFDNLSDEDLEKYLKLLQKKQRSQIISLLHFDPESAGGRMNSDVITLQKDFTVKKSIELLQRLNLQEDLMERIYVTNKDNVLMGHITLETLVFNKPETQLAQVLRKNELHIYVDEDQEDVANQMHHYDLSSAPVVDKQNHFLGVITASDVVEIIKEEENEDAYKRFGLSTVEYSYFATPAWRLVMQRSTWLISLLVFQSISSYILGNYDNLIQKYAVLTIFLGMLTGTGGNAGNQSATLVIRGLTTKEMTTQNAMRVLLREFMISMVIASLLFIAGFCRVYYSYPDFLTALAINLSLGLIIVVSMTLGAVIPMLLEYFDIDPAHSAAPFLTTLMDILGVIIYCYLFSKIVS